MQNSIKISSIAERDTENAIDYYFAINIDLAVRFKDELYATYEKIIANPELYKYLSKKGSKQFRCTKLKSFPYIIIYRIDHSTIIIVSVFNTHRKPVYK